MPVGTIRPGTILGMDCPQGRRNHPEVVEIISLFDPEKGHVIILGSPDPLIKEMVVESSTRLEVFCCLVGERRDLNVFFMSDIISDTMMKAKCLETWTATYLDGAVRLLEQRSRAPEFLG